MPDFKDPTELKLVDEGFRLKFSGKAIFEVLLRGAVDWAKGSLGGGTLPALLKVVTVKSNEERDAYLLITKSLMRAFRDQIGEELDQAHIDEQENIVIQNTQLDLTAFELLTDNSYTFNLHHFQRPEQMPVLQDFGTAYKSWLKDNFGMSDSRAGGLSAEFRYYFGFAFYEEVRTGSYGELNAWKNNEFLVEQKSLINRHRYNAQLRELYYGQSLGQQDVCLADVYIEPDFLVLDKLLSAEKQAELKERKEPKRSDHFLSTKYPHSIHDYVSQHFLVQKKSAFLNCEQEESRMLVLLGQPGHGKSSFCYRTAHDLLSDSKFGGSVHLVRLRETRKQVIQSTEEEFIRLLGKEGVTPLVDWKNTQQPSVLLLDGLDELCMSQGLKDSDVRELIQGCKRMLDDYPYLFIVLTSRFNYLPSDRLRQASILVLSLATLTATQQEHLIIKYAESKKESVIIDREFLREINQNTRLLHVQELIELPILLQMILISKIDLQAANSRASIYNELFTQVLDRKWDQAGRLGKYLDANDFQPADLRKYLAFLAFKIYQSPRGYLNRSEINSFPETKTFKREFLTNSGGDQGINTVLKDVLTSFYLKERRKDQEDEQEEEQRQYYAIEFLHKSLYEYLCCEYLWNATKAIFLKPDGKPQFCDFAEVGERVQRLFALTRLSSEMIDYLNEIINQDRACHVALQQAMSHTLPTMLSYGCIHQYPLVGDSLPPLYTPSQQALHVFHAFWVTLGQLQTHKIRTVDFFFNNWEKFYQLYLADTLNSDLVKIYELPEGLAQEDFSQLPISEQALLRRKVFVHLNRDYRPNLEADVTTKITHWLRGIGAERLPLKIDFRLTNFHYADFYGLWAEQINFIGADLSRVNFIGTDLSGANLIGANLSGANLSGANLSGTYLSGAYLSEADLIGANLIGANLTGANLTGANLTGAYLTGADLSGAYLSGAYLPGAYLSGASLRGANLSGVDLIRVDLSGAYLRGADLSGAYLRGAYLSGANLSGANLSGANLSGADLSGADLMGVQLEKGITLDSTQYKGLTEASQEYLSEAFFVEHMDSKEAGGLEYLFSLKEEE